MSRLEDSRYDMIYLNPNKVPSSSATVLGEIEEPNAEVMDDGQTMDGKANDAEDGQEDGMSETGDENKVDTDFEHSVFAVDKSPSELVKSEDGFYYCRYCDRGRSAIKREMLMHERKHTGVKPYECSVCSKRFTRQEHINRHMTTHTGEKPYKCSRCERAFTRRDHMVVHERTHAVTGKYRFRCLYCAERFANKKDLLAHENRHTKSKDVEEESESSVDIINDKLLLEQDRVGGDDGKESEEVVVDIELVDYISGTSDCDRLYGCSYCDYSSPHKSHLESHERTHISMAENDCENNPNEQHFLDVEMYSDKFTVVDRKGGRKSYVCKCCDDYTTCSKIRLEEHIRWHMGQRYVCSYCGVAFTRRDFFIKHLKVHSERREHTCGVCGKQFPTKYKLNRHSGVHRKESLTSVDVKLEEEEDVCAKDDQVYLEIDGNWMMGCYPPPVRRGRKSKEDLKKMGEFFCKFCDNYTCTTARELQAHQLSHDSEKPYECKHCQTTFSRLGHLTRHVRVHTGERPFECSICSKTFTRKDHLDKHWTVHTGEKPHKCKICNKKFSRHYHLVSHERKHVEEDVSK